jgi:putative membrane protein
MKRTRIDFLKIYLKGMAMGAADAVPGVSGGTIALIIGVYEELINSISSINSSLIKTLINDGISEFWKKLNGDFLIALFSGVVISLVIVMNFASYLIENYPILIWSFFLGLVSASIYAIIKQTNILNTHKINIHFWNYFLLLISTFISYKLTNISGLEIVSQNSMYLIVAGFIASCAMILPGISGSYILVVLGLYNVMSKAVINFEIKKITLFALGIMLGLTSFSKIIKWGYKKYPNKILLFITGLILGSIHKLWPWKINIQTTSEENVSPFDFKDENYLIFSIILFIIGFLLIFILEKNNSSIEKK